MSRGDDPLVDAVVALNPHPRDAVWASVSLCVLDAVWSINANYSTTVVPLVRRFATHHGIAAPVVPPGQIPDVDPIPTTVLAGFSEAALVSLGNRQRTSTRGGITKAEAAIQYASILNERGVISLSDARELVKGDEGVRNAEVDLAKVRGHGSDGVRVGYLWMLVGDDDVIKPDRMVTRWLSRALGRAVTPADARAIIERIAPAVGERQQRNVTLWEVDHAIWLAERARRA